MRADKLEFNISYSDSAYPENASKLRVFCYMKNGGYAFGDEFEDKYSATFDSNRTSKYSGYGTITIQLLDAEENLINSANVVCKIIESNSTTPFVVSPDFTEQSKFEVQAIVDNGKLQIVEATKEAKEEIDSWTDQSSRIAKNESNITDLQLFKANTGALHIKGKLQSNVITNINVNSLACRLKFSQEQWDNLAGGSHFVSLQNYLDAFRIRKPFSGDALFYGSINSKHSDGSTKTDAVYVYGKNTFNYNSYHNLILTLNENEIKFYLDGVLVGSKARTAPAFDSLYMFSNYEQGDMGEISDIAVFNFDMSSADAPYTIEDYQNGKPIPPSLLTGNEINYTLQANSTFTQRVPDSNFSLAQGEDGYITANADAVSGSNPYFWLPFGKTLKAGSNIEISLYTNRYSGFGNFGFSLGNSGSTTLVQSITRGNTMTYTLSADVNCIALNGTRDTALKEDILLSVKADGTILALEDYTIANGNSKFVFDYSGNNNDATIIGNVNGDNDNRVQKLVDFITTLS